MGGNLSTNNHSRPHCSHSQTLGSNLEKQSDCKVEFGDWTNISTIGGRFYKGDLFIRVSLLIVMELMEAVKRRNKVSRV